MNPKLLPEINIGLVGHVDHGKTTLTKAITGRWTDTHSEELKRGITIRLGYADATFYKCSKCPEPQCYNNSGKCLEHGESEIERTVSFLDAPGHETLMATVLSGASIMDGAMLLIAADEQCPQPQTAEHLQALQISGIKNIVIVQNKIDLVTPEQAKKHYDQIKKFVKGTVAENASVVPISAQLGINIDLLIQTIEKTIPTPKRNPSVAPRFLCARSFDINKPGTPIAELNGGVLGGSVISGSLKVGDTIEIRPGIRRERENKIYWEPITTEIVSLEKARISLPEAGVGGLVGMVTKLDPALTKADALSGTVIGMPGKLPPLIDNLFMEPNLLERVVGSKEELKTEPIKTGDVLLLNATTTKTAGVVVSASPVRVEVKLKIPIAADKGEKIVISRQVAGRWRLIGWGTIK